MDKERIADGLTLLANTKEFAKRVKQLHDIIADWEDTPLLFGGALEPLNALIDVGLAKPEALGKLIELAEKKRRSVPETKRIDYQRELMREKRERLYRAVELEELVRGSPLKGAARQRYMTEKQARWMDERAAFIESKGVLSWKERNEAAGQFWRQVDEQLARDLDEAKAVLGRPPAKRKRVVKLAKPTPDTALGRAMAAAKRP